jgi:hypothetical protein
MVIKCKNESKLLAVLAKLSAGTDYLWYSGDKPDGYNVPSDKFPIWIKAGESHRLTWTADIADVTFDNNELTDDEFLKAGGVPTTENDPVNHPSHYTQGKVECIDAMEQVLGREAVMHYCLGATFKYLWRRKLKENEEQDIQKSLWYFDRFVEMINR